MKSIIFSIIFLISVEHIGIAQSQWLQRSSMFDYGRHVSVNFTIGNLAYVGLGAIWDGSRPPDFWTYHPKTNTWTQVGNFPGGGRYSATSFSINGKGYVCFGLDSAGNVTNDLWEYNPSSDIWKKKNDFPGIGRYGAISFVIGDNAFICSGSYGNSENYLFDLWLYNSSTDSWQRKADFPGQNRCHATAFTCDDFGYVGMGLANSVTETKDFWKYSPIDDNWVRCTDFPGQPRLGCVSFVIGEQAYVGLGFDQINDFNSFCKYNPRYDIWELMPVEDEILPRRGSTSFSVDSIGYFCTGETAIGLLPDLWAYSSTGWTCFNKIYENRDLVIYPNPGLNIINICNSSSLENETLSFYDLLGQEVLTVELKIKNFQADVSTLPCGTYFVRIISKNKQKVIKFIKAI